jgi:N-acetylglutamate synthase-like GNAT family acetyltransferase
VKKAFWHKPSYLIGCFNENNFCGALFAFDQGKRVFIGELAVEERYRGKLIGRKLIEELENRAKADHKNIIYLGAQERAVEFYFKLGYSPLLFLQIRKNEAPKDFASRLKAYNVKDIVEKKENDGMDFKVTIKVKGLDKILQRKAERDLNAYNSIFLFEKVIK